MLALRGIVVVLALAFVYSQAAEIKALIFYLRNWNLPTDSPNNLTKGTLFINYDDTFPLASCNVTKPNLEKTCTITLSKPGGKDRICNNIKITAGKNRELFLGGFFQVMPFNDDKAIVGWYDESKEVDPATSKAKERDLRINILDFGKCTTSDLSFAIDKIAYGFFPALVFYTNRIDFVLNSKKSCGGIDRCRLSFDLNAKQIGGINPYQPEVSQYASAVSPSSPDKGFFMSNQDLKSLEVLLVDSAGKGKEILKTNLIANAVAQRVAFSNGHEIYGTCWTSEEENKPSVVHCAQFDATGKQIFNNGTVKAAKPVRALSVRNLPEGGLLLLTASDTGNSEDGQSLRIIHVRKNGDVGKPTSLEGPGSECFKKTSDLEVRVYESKGDRYCFEYACLINNKHVVLTGRCLPSKQLQQS